MPAWENRSWRCQQGRERAELEDPQGCAGGWGSTVSGFHCQPAYRSHQLRLGYSSWLFRLGHGPEATSCRYKGRNVTLSLQCQGGEICRLVCDLHCWPMQVLFKGPPHSALDTDTRLERENEKSRCWKRSSLYFPFISVNKLSFDLLGFVGLGGCFPFKDLLLYYVFFPLVNKI